MKYVLVVCWYCLHVDVPLIGTTHPTPQEAIDRIHQLQEMSRLTGVIDDRGKFIYISQEEMEAVAGFIKQQGRVSIQDLASASSRLVHLQHTRSTAVH